MRLNDLVEGSALAVIWETMRWTFDSAHGSHS